MPVQQSMDIGLPIETVYNQWTQFEEWPKFMHRVTRVTQENECTVSFSVKIWGKTKEFTAKIETQRPNDRIKWKTTQGMTHTGVVVFRELGPNLTRVMLSFDVAPGGLLEKYARGTRYIKRAARADFHRLVAFIEMLEQETGAWRGVIEDGELVEDHDPSYDEEREYADADEIVHGRESDDSDEDEDEDSDEDEDDDDDEPRQRGRNGGEPRARTRRSSGDRQSSGGRRSSASSSRAQSRSSGSSSRSPSGSRSSSSRSSGSSRKSGSSNGRSSSAKSSSGRSSSGRSSSGRSSSGRSSTAKSSGAKTSSKRSSSSGRSSGGSSSGRSPSGSGRSRSSGTKRKSSAEHQGRQRSRSSRRS
jgi:hypothetical protein